MLLSVVALTTSLVTVGSATPTIIGFLGRTDAADSAYESFKEALAHEAFVVGMQVLLISSSSVVDLRKRVSDATEEQPNARVLYVGHGMHGGAASLQEVVQQQPSIAGLVLVGGFLRRSWRPSFAECAEKWATQPTHSCPKGKGLPLCPGGYLPDGVHNCVGPQVPTPTFEVPTLTIGGSLDGVVRIARIAEAWYTQHGSDEHQVALVEGMNHGDLMDNISGFVAEKDLQSEIGADEARAAVSKLVVAFAREPRNFTAVSLDAWFSPFVEMFVKQEGSWWWTSNSDETGSSVWAATAQKRMAEPMPLGFEAWTVSNEFHLLSDESNIPPYYRERHRPHVTLSDDRTIVMSRTVAQLRYIKLTVTETAMGLNGYAIIKEEKAGILSNPIYPDDGDAAAAAIEIATKLASRQAAYNVTAGGNPPSTLDDGDRCKTINQAAYDLAVAIASPEARERFRQKGRPLVMVADKKPTPPAGPWWIWNYLSFDDKGAQGVEVQSWYAFYPLSGPTYGAGNHYCKLLSPARALEWVYTDSLRPSRKPEPAIMI